MTTRRSTLREPEQAVL